MTSWLLPLLMLIGIVLLLFLLIQAGYGTQWTGFGGYDKKTTANERSSSVRKVTTTTEHQPRKTLWDWLQLLIIPLVLASATIGFGWWQTHLADLQHQSDQQRALDQQRATTLQTYIDNIQDLLLNHNLLGAKPDDAVAILARARTLTALQGLDSERKGLLVKFIYEARLIGFEDSYRKIYDPIIYLDSADLSDADLSGAVLIHAHLSGANLSGAFLVHAHLNNAHLNNADLSGALIHADLSSADLSGAHLNNADLSGAFLVHAHLSGAVLSGANLIHALLNYADLNNAHLSDADLSGAVLIHADLSLANLNGANLSGALLNNADFIDADLSRAHNLTQQQLDDVKTCKNATLPPGLTCHHNQ